MGMLSGDYLLQFLRQVDLDDRDWDQLITRLASDFTTLDYIKGIVSKAGREFKLEWNDEIAVTAAEGSSVFMFELAQAAIEEGANPKKVLTALEESIARAKEFRDKLRD